MVLEIKSIFCVESLKKIPEIFGLENGKADIAFVPAMIFHNDVLFFEIHHCEMLSFISLLIVFVTFSDSNWLNRVCYTLSVRTGTLVFAYQTKIIVLSIKWDSRTHQSRYTITWSDELPPYDNITAVLCIPITNGDEVNKFKTIIRIEITYGYAYFI